MNFRIRRVLLAIALIILSLVGIQYFISKQSTTIQIPSIIINGNIGGIGNQLFRYAFAYKLSNQLNIPLYLQVNLTQLPNRTFESTKREFLLDFFQLNSNKFEYLPKSLKVISELSTSTFKDKIYSFSEKNIWKGIFPSSDKILTIDDYFESEYFFEVVANEIKQQFQFNEHKIIAIADTNQQLNRTMRILQDIESSESIGVHFRRGDFYTKGINHVLPFSYQLRAMKLMKSILLQSNNNDGDNLRNIKYFIFSDNIEFIKSHVNFNKLNKKNNNNNNTLSIVFVSNVNNSILEFYLLSKCKHQIVPNSTFSWWAAYLNKNPRKVIIAASPKNKASFYDKYKNEQVKKCKILLGTKYAYPKDWLVLNPFEFN